MEAINGVYSCQSCSHLSFEMLFDPCLKMSVPQLLSPTRLENGFI
jgi:hypothetical protein